MDSADQSPFDFAVADNATQDDIDAMENLKATMEEKYEELTANVQEWKAGMLNAFLLNEEVSLYDWSQGQSLCVMAKDYTPCCTTDPNEYGEWVQYSYYLSYTPCRESPAYKEFIIDGQNTCKFKKVWTDDTFTKEVECPLDRRTGCVYDMNGVGCCTENMALLHSWHDSGCVGGECGVVQILLNDDVIENFIKYNPPLSPHILYALQTEGIKDRYNFECPTHHPVPAVAILLGCFIPALVILLVVIFIMKRRNGPIKKDEEE